MKSRRHFSDAEIIDVLKKYTTNSDAADALGMSERNLRKRKATLKINTQKLHVNKAEYRAGITDGTVIVFSDAHFWPGIRSTAFKGLLWAIKELKPYLIINNGDAFDGAAISRHPRIQWQSGPSVKEELDACQSALKEIQEAAVAARHNTKLVWTLGNHDSRMESRLSQSAPEFEGVAGFTLKDHFPDWHPCWSCWPTDNVIVKHRYKNGVHATHNNTVNAGVSVVTGHLHSLKVTPFSDLRGNRFGVDTGTLAEVDGPQFIDYLEMNPTNWRSGFAVLTFKDSKLLWPELVHKWGEDEIEFRGQIINVGDL
jgi:hypothetical protein